MKIHEIFAKAVNTNKYDPTHTRPFLIQKHTVQFWNFHKLSRRFSFITPFHFGKVLFSFLLTVKQKKKELFRKFSLPRLCLLTKMTRSVLNRYLLMMLEFLHGVWKVKVVI